jgi:putative transposase
MKRNCRRKEHVGIVSKLVCQFSGKQRNFNGENFWARGYAVSTVGFELEAVRHYIREQEMADKGGQF